jgi:hypothetical protein
VTAKELEERLAARAIYASVKRSHAGIFDIEIDNQATLRQVQTIAEIVGTDDITIKGGNDGPGDWVTVTAVPKP